MLEVDANMNHKLSKYEMETTITFNRDEPNASIYTTDPVMLRKLDKLCSQTPVITVLREDEISKTYICPKKLVSVHKPRKLLGSGSKKGHSGEDGELQRKNE